MVTPPAAPRVKLTPRQREVLQVHCLDSGLIPEPLYRGFERIAWNRMMASLVRDGVVKHYVHGGYEITEAGRAALVEGSAE